MEEHATNAKAITTALVSIWEFREWTDSRWLTMGFCSRRMVASMLTGLDNLETMLCGTKHISEYYIKAYTIITDKHRRAMIVGALSSHQSDAVLCGVVADNPVPLNLPTIDAELRAEMEYISGVKSKI